MEMKIENDRIFIKYEGNNEWVELGELDRSGGWCVKPLHLEEEQAVEEVKLQGINIELSAIL